MDSDNKVNHNKSEFYVYWRAQYFFKKKKTLSRQMLLNLTKGGQLSLWPPILTWCFGNINTIVQPLEASKSINKLWHNRPFLLNKGLKVCIITSIFSFCALRGPEHSECGHTFSTEWSTKHNDISTRFPLEPVDPLGPWFPTGPWNNID